MTFGFSMLVSCLFAFEVAAQSGQVLRIKSSNCAYNSKGTTTNFATGFVYQENGQVVGVITALHAVCGCSTISAEDNSGNDYFSLKVIKADIGNDVALLTSNEIGSKFSEGLEFSSMSPSSFSGKKISMIARPYRVKINRDFDGQVQNTPTTQLNKFVWSEIEQNLKDRGSPKINNSVLNLNIEITPGCSGAPILMNNKQVIGIANGGLDEGRTSICWATPSRNVDLKPISNIGIDYERLKHNNPNELFVLTCNLDESASKIITVYPRTPNEYQYNNYTKIENYRESREYVDVIGAVVFRMDKNNNLWAIPYIKTDNGQVAKAECRLENYSTASYEIANIIGDYTSDSDVIYFLNRDSDGTHGTGDRIRRGDSLTFRYKNIDNRVGSFTVEFKTDGTIGLYYKFYENDEKKYVGVRYVRK